MNIVDMTKVFELEDVMYERLDSKKFRVIDLFGDAAPVPVTDPELIQKLEDSITVSK